VGGKDGKMVKSGWAVSYDNYYNDAEATAKESKSGIWQGKFMRPELYRALNRSKDKHKKNKKI
jgi:endonuclease YncB( thermonuclease family)